MADTLLPPVVATFAATYVEFMTATEAVMGGLDGVQATAVRASEGTNASLVGMGAEAERAAAQVDTSTSSMVASLDRLSVKMAGDAAKWDVETAAMSASMDRMAANVDAAAARAAAANEKLGGTTASQAAVVQSRIGAAGSALMGFGTTVGAVAGGAALATVMMAGTFDQKMMLIRTNAHDSTDSIQAMSQSVLQMAGDVGQTPDKLAEGLYHITSTGQRGAQALDILRASAKDATIGIADLDTVTYAMSGVMSIGMADVKNAADGVAYLNTIVGQGDMHMQDLSNAIGTGVLPAFKSAGLGMADFGAALSTLTDNSTPAEVAANHLKTTVQLLQNQSGPATKALKDLGIGTGQLASDISKPGGLMVAVMDLKTHMDDYSKSAGGVKLSQVEVADAVKNMAAELTKEGVSTQEQTDLLGAYRSSLTHMGSAGIQAAADLSKAFGGARSAMTMETLVQESGKLQSKYNEMGTAASRQAQAQRDWNDTQAQFKVKLQDAKASAEALGISIGNLLMPFVMKVMSLFQGFTSVLTHHHNIAQALAILIGGALVMAVAALTAGTIAWAIAIQGTPLGWIMDAIAGLTVLAMVLVSNWSSIAGFFSDLWHSVTGFFWDAVHAIGDALHSIGGFFSDLWTSVSGFFGDIGNAIGGFVMDVIHWFERLWWEGPLLIQELADFLGRAFPAMGRAMLSGIQAAGRAILTFFQNLPYEIGFLLGALAGLAARGAMTFGLMFYRGIVIAFEAVKTFFRNLPGWVMGFVINAGIWLVTSGRDIIVGLVNGIVAAYQDVAAWFNALPGRVMGFVINAGIWLVTSGAALITGFGQGITAAFWAVIDWFKALPARVAGFFSDVRNWIVSKGNDLIVGFGQGITSAFWAVVNWFHDLPGRIGGFFSDTWHWLLNAGTNLVYGFLQGIENAAGWLLDQIKSFARGVINGFLSAFGIHSPSTEMEPIGKGLVDGITHYLGIHGPTAINAAKTLAGQVVGAMAGAAGSASMNISATGSGGTAFNSSMSGAGGVGTTVVNVYPQNLVGTVNDLRDQMLTAFQQRGLRNGSAQTFPSFRLG